MKESEEIVGLFRQKLGKAELPVNDGFWEALQGDLSPAALPKKGSLRPLSSSWCRVAAAASVVLVLGMASAAFWYFSPKEDMEEAFTQVSAYVPGGQLDGDRVEEVFPRMKDAASIPPSAGPVQTVLPQRAEDGGEDEQTVSVRVSIRVTQQMYGRPGRNVAEGYQAGMKGAETYADASARNHKDVEDTSARRVEKEPQAKPAPKSREWALKAYVGSELPSGDFSMPLTAGVSVERHLSRLLSVEAGLQYNRLHDVAMPEGKHTYHTLAIPVRMNVQLADNDRFDLYATVGGSVEKCVAGAADNSFSAEPVRLAVAAGIGVRYKLNDRFALFAEPTVTHHFDTDSSSASLRTERPTNLNLLCGVRMTY